MRKFEERGFFTFGGVSSRDYGVFVNGNQTFSSPAREIEVKSVPGRNGDLIFDKGRFSNIPHAYDAFIAYNLNANLGGLRNLLASKTGYQRLEDSYHPDEFYLAMFVAGLEVETTPDMIVGSFTITFNRKPQRFLKIGERKHTFESNGVLMNKTNEIATPLIRVYGTGELGIGEETIKINENPGYIDLDCEMENAFMGSENCNGNIELNSDDFPRLPPGKTGVSLGSGITKVEIIPRWWRL